MNSATPTTVAPGRSSVTRLVVLVVLALGLVAGLLALGNWQIQRRAWKHQLVDRIEQRVHAPPVAVPDPGQWPQISAEQYEYRHLIAQGRYLHAQQTLVQASTALGSGFWVLTPLLQADGTTVLVNRGFIPGEQRVHYAQASTGSTEQGEVRVTGLLRISEPGGGFLRDNNPVENRWYSRDVQDIAHARGLTQVAPFFIDADAEPAATVQAGLPRAPREPVAGLTLIHFADNHLAYALTWYVLALMTALAAGYVGREEYQRWRRPHGHETAQVGNDAQSL